MLEYRHRVASETDRIRDQVYERPPRIDLVINSWAPVGVDLTDPVQLLNPAGIMFAIERMGSTGMHEDAPRPTPPKRPSDRESYHPGRWYKSSQAWMTHSTPQVRARMHEGVQRFDQTRFGDVPYANVFLFQQKAGYAQTDRPPIEPEQNGLRLGNAYPWEAEYNRRKGGDITPFPLQDTSDGKSPHFTGILNREIKKQTGKEMWD